MYQIYYILHDKIIFNGITDKEWIASKFIDDVFKSEKLIPVHAEYLIYDEELGLASMIDCIAKNNKNEYFILDWKTNKKIDKNRGGSKDLIPLMEVDLNYNTWYEVGYLLRKGK